MASKYQGLVTTQGDKHQALYQGLMNMGANLGGYSDKPMGLLNQFSKGGQGFNQGYQGSLQQTKQDQLQQMQAQSAQAEMEAQELKIAEMGRLAKMQEMQERMKSNYLAIDGSVDKNSRPDGSGQTSQDALKAYMPAEYGQAQIDSNFGLGSGASETWGKTPVWGEDDSGNQVLGSISSAGNFKALDTDGFTPQRQGLSKVDLGDEWAWTDASGVVVKRIPKKLDPSQTPEHAAKVVGAKGAATAEVDATASQVANAPAINAFNIGMAKVEAAYAALETDPVTGLFPAYTAEEQMAESSTDIMAPILKSLFREAGEGTFSEGDQRLLLNMAPKRTDRPETVAFKIDMIRQMVAAKLGDGGAPKPAEDLSELTAAEQAELMELRKRLDQ